MSIIIEKAGILDTVQDAGRFGFGHLGINPNGPMDWQAHQLANALVGNELGETIIESHFPAPHIRITKPCVLAFSGADFHAQINGVYLPINRTLFVPEGAQIQFTKKVTGARAYIAIGGGYAIEKILGSTSTNLKAAFGGRSGRKLAKGDELHFNKVVEKKIETIQIKPWFAQADYTKDHFIRVIEGPECSLLSSASKQVVMNESFNIQPQSDRMAMLLAGLPLSLSKPIEMISSAVLMGTIQLLPNGQLLALMADHQTVGGYPRVLQVIRADLPKLAQMEIGQTVRLQSVDIDVASKALHAMCANIRNIGFSLKQQLLF